MNEQLQNQLATIFGQIASGVKVAGDFTVAQLPDVVQQFLIKGFIAEAIFSTVFFIAAVVSSFICLTIWRAANSDKRDADEWAGPAVFMGIFALGMFVFFLVGVYGMLSIWLAPKAWLITEFARMLK